MIIYRFYLIIKKLYFQVSAEGKILSQSGDKFAPRQDRCSVRREDELSIQHPTCQTGLYVCIYASMPLVVCFFVCLACINNNIINNFDDFYITIT